MRHSHRSDNGRYKRSTWLSWTIIFGVLVMATYSVIHARGIQSSIQAQAAETLIPVAYAQEVPVATTTKKISRFVKATAYTSRPEETDSKPCESASGVDICELINNLSTIPADGICATNDYPFGTRLLVGNLGVCIVLDRMNSRFKPGTGHLDWYFGHDLPGAQQFGTQTLSIIKL